MAFVFGMYVVAGCGRGTNTTVASHQVVSTNDISIGVVRLLVSLGTPADQKRHVIFEAGRSDHARGETIREVLSWLDRDLGPVRVNPS